MVHNFAHTDNSENSTQNGQPKFEGFRGSGREGGKASKDGLEAHKVPTSFVKSTPEVKKSKEQFDGKGAQDAKEGIFLRISAGDPQGLTTNRQVFGRRSSVWRQAKRRLALAIGSETASGPNKKDHGDRSPQRVTTSSERRDISRSCELVEEWYFRARVFSVSKF